MFGSRAIPSACRCSTRVRPQALPRLRVAVRQVSTRASPRPNHAAWLTATALSASLLGFSLWQLRPELLPALSTLQAESEPPAKTYIDPTTSTLFPSILESPSGSKLRLVGTGVRTVSFLSIRVYAAGYYVEDRVFKELETIEGWKDFAPEKLLPPFPKAEEDGLVGEALVGTLLDAADVAVVIIPLRNTTLPHLRDGFSRALVARMKLPHVSSSLSEAASESAVTALSDLKSFFPGRTLTKGSPLELYFSSSKKTVLFQMRDQKNAKPDVLGTLSDPTLAKQLFLSYFSDSLETSPELRKSVARGLAGEPRGLDQ